MQRRSNVDSHRELHVKKNQSTIVQQQICYERAASVLKFLAFCTQEQPRSALTAKGAVLWNQKGRPTNNMDVAGIAGTEDMDVADIRRWPQQAY